MLKLYIFSFCHNIYKLYPKSFSFYCKEAKATSKLPTHSVIIKSDKSLKEILLEQYVKYVKGFTAMKVSSLLAYKQLSWGNFTSLPD